jgi:saccharopine dehydrogenase-like NADP-dependent oxidoreductase
VAYRILLIGATGVFGSRLAELLDKEPGIQLILAGRHIETLHARAQKLQNSCEIAVLDRNFITSSDLEKTRCQLVIDAAGPFDSHITQVISSALDAGIHYIDLADGREFVKNIGRFDAQAKARNCAILTGASSIPALSHAVIDSLTQDWQSYDTLKVGIFPGNRAPRGLAVVESILTYVGKPVRVFLNGAWQDIPGWGMTHRKQIPFVGKRWASVCNTPDQDLLVERYHPKLSAEFFAGLELSLLHLGLWLLSLPVRWGWLPSLLPYAKPMLTIAKWLLPFGTDKGGMTVEVCGTDHSGKPAQISWALNADANRGPYIPTLAALALARKFRDGKIAFRGAQACVGILALDDFQQDFESLELELHSAIYTS